MYEKLIFFSFCSKFRLSVLFIHGSTVVTIHDFNKNKNSYVYLFQHHVLYTCILLSRGYKDHGHVSLMLEVSECFPKSQDHLTESGKKSFGQVKISFGLVEIL